MATKLKRIVLGDVHGHWDTVEKIYENEDPDSVIILGDYFDNFHGSDESIIECFRNIQALQEKHNKEKRGEFILIIGNHDFHYLTFIEHYSGFRSSYATFAHEELNKMLEKKLIKFVHVSPANKTIYSHAGVTNMWLHENAKFKVCDDNLNYINDMNLVLFRFTYKGGGNVYGDTPYSSPIWVRPNALKMDMYVGDNDEQWTQIVGHTQSRNPQLFKDFFQVDNTPEAIEKYLPNIYQIDCLPNAFIRETYDLETEVIEKREIIKVPN